MQLTIDLPLSAEDRALLEPLLGVTPEPAAPAKAAPKPAKAAKVEPAPTPEPEAEVDLIGAGPTIEDAVNRATAMVAEGKTPVVKAALDAVGAKRVSEIKAEDVTAFFAALDA